ncbi:peptidase M35, partial [Pelomonas sp. HMWF004]
TGTDSKGGTLVHEMMHFNVIAGTDDWAYGQSAALSLAKSNPTRALDNSDSHEYFAENTPAKN